jgi:hypothetical protein
MSVGPSQFDAFAESLLVELRSLQEQISAIRNAAEASIETQREVPAQLSLLRIPENEKTAAKSHRDKAYRQQVILTWVTGGAFLAAAVYAGIAASQLDEMRISNENVRHQVTEAQNTLDTSMEQFDRSMKQIITQTNAQRDAAKASLIAAQSANKQREAMERQNDLMVQQASAELVFQNYVVSEEPATPEQPATRVVSFDLANVGGSAATQISEAAGEGIYHQIDAPTQATAGAAQIDPAGFSLDRGQSKTIKIDTIEWGRTRNSPGGGDSYTFRRYTYLTIFHKAQTVCILLIGHKGGPQRAPCLTVEPKQP